MDRRIIVGDGGSEREPVAVIPAQRKAPGGRFAPRDKPLSRRGIPLTFGPQPSLPGAQTPVIGEGSGQKSVCLKNSSPVLVRIGTWSGGETPDRRLLSDFRRGDDRSARLNGPSDLRAPKPRRLASVLPADPIRQLPPSRGGAVARNSKPTSSLAIRSVPR